MTELEKLHLRQLTPCLIGLGAGMFDGASDHLMQTRLKWRTGMAPELQRPYAKSKRTIFGQECLPAGPGWVDESTSTVCARSLQDLIATALAAADLFEANPQWPWSLDRAAGLRRIAASWEEMDSPDPSALKHWPMDARPEVLA